MAVVVFQCSPRETDASFVHREDETSRRWLAWVTMLRELLKNGYVIDT
jgi:hypothetical protein